MDGSVMKHRTVFCGRRCAYQVFIWDFVADTVLGQIIDWIYGQIVGFLGDFFMQMGNMGADLFEMTWV